MNPKAILPTLWSECYMLKHYLNIQWFEVHSVMTFLYVHTSLVDIIVNKILSFLLHVIANYNFKAHFDQTKHMNINEATKSTTLQLSHCVHI